jgi:hypothetical protein
VLNGDDHLRELRDAMPAALPGTPAGERAAQGERLRLDHGADLLAAEFRSVTRHDFAAELVIPGPGPVEDYVRSMITTQELPAPEDFVAAVSSLLRRNHPEVRIRTHSGCLVAT